MLTKNQRQNVTPVLLLCMIIWSSWLEIYLVPLYNGKMVSICQSKISNIYSVSNSEYEGGWTKQLENTSVHKEKIFF